MARTDSRDSAVSSLSILVGDAAHLDDNFTVFAELTAEDDPKAKELEPDTEWLQ